MQITQAPPLPPTSTTMAQPQTLPSILPAVVTQAIAPIAQNAVAPTAKGEGGERSRRRGERSREDAPDKEGSEQRGGHLNISV